MIWALGHRLPRYLKNLDTKFRDLWKVECQMPPQPTNWYVSTQEAEASKPAITGTLARDSDPFDELGGIARNGPSTESTSIRLYRIGMASAKIGLPTCGISSRWERHLLTAVSYAAD